MPNCVVFKCPSRSGLEYRKTDPVSFYRFPFRDKDRLQQWVINIRRINWTPTKHSRLCERHFEKDCMEYKYGKKRILPNAVPTIFTYYQTLPLTKQELRYKTRLSTIEPRLARLQQLLTHTINPPASPHVCLDHNYTTATETSEAILKEEMTRLQQTQIRLLLHANVLDEYCRNGVIPLELRIQVAPTIGSYNKDFNKKWCDALDKCSLDLLRLVIEELLRQKEDVRRDIVNQEALMMQKLGDDFTTIDRCIKSTLKKFEEGLYAERAQEYDRDRLDHQLNQVYKWTFGVSSEEGNPDQQQSHAVSESSVISEHVSEAVFNQPQQGLNHTGKSGRLISSAHIKKHTSALPTAKDTVISLSIKEMRRSQMLAHEERRREIVAERRRKLESLTEPKNGHYFVLKYPDGSTKKRKFLRSQPFQDLVAFAGSDDVATELFSIQPLSSQIYMNMSCLQSTLTGNISNYIGKQVCTLHVRWFSSQLQDCEIVDSVTTGSQH